MDIREDDGSSGPSCHGVLIVIDWMTLAVSQSPLHLYYEVFINYGD
jgi:hypothetical protein